MLKLEKKQFVHHVYVSNDDGEGIWWTTGDESHGPYHTNKDLYIQGKPVFYDTVSISGNFFPGDKRPYNFTYNPDFKIKQPKQPEKIGRLEFPTTNQYLKQWAEKDNMVFYGRTCIYLDGDKVKIRNGNAKQEAIQIIPISNIKNKVIYVDNDTEESKWKNIKFDLGAGNIYISGRLEGQLTIAAANNIYITATDPTNWYDEEDEKYQNPPTKYPQDSSKVYGITYANTKFNENKPKGILSYEDKEKGIWTRDANGKDMLGLVAQNDILILHYGWPRYWNGTNDKYDKSYWNYRWKNKKKENFTYDLAPQNITIHAHLFAIEGGFGYEGHNQGGSRGNITLWGNITQNKRKAVGLVNGVGYKKRYAHDPRMFYDYPPHVLEPTNVGWEVHDWRETYEHVKEKTKGDDTH